MNTIPSFLNGRFFSEEFHEERSIHLKLMLFIIPLLISIIFWDFYELNAKLDIYYILVKGSLIGSLIWLAYRNYKKLEYLKYLYWCLFLLFTYSYYGLVYIHFTYFYSFWEMYFVISFFFKISRKAYVLLLSFGVCLNFIAIQLVSEPNFIKANYSYKPHMIVVTAIVIFLTVLLFFSVTKKYEELNKLQRKFAQIGKQSSFVLHEIQKPLNRLIKEEKQNPEDFKKISNIILNIELMLNRPEEFTKSFEVVYLNSIFDGIKNELQDFFKVYGIVFRFESDDVFVSGNKDLLFQVFKNLIVNSIEAIERDIELVSKNIDIFIERNHNHIMVSVVNSKSNEELNLSDNIFNPFVSSKNNSSNRGLGLSFCKNIIEGHNGKISVINNKDSTKFLVKLPI